MVAEVAEGEAERDDGCGEAGVDGGGEPAANGGVEQADVDADNDGEGATKEDAEEEALGEELRVGVDGCAQKERGAVTGHQDAEEVAAAKAVCQLCDDDGADKGTGALGGVGGPDGGEGQVERLADEWTEDVDGVPRPGVEELREEKKRRTRRCGGRAGRVEGSGIADGVDIEGHSLRGGTVTVPDTTCDGDRLPRGERAGGVGYWAARLRWPSLIWTSMESSS